MLLIDYICNGVEDVINRILSNVFNGFGNFVQEFLPDEL